jgi:hypothetical protein
MKSIIQVLILILISSATASPVLAKDGGKPPEPKPRVEIVRQPKSDSKVRTAESSRDQQRDGNSDRDRSRSDREKPQVVENS